MKKIKRPNLGGVPYVLPNLLTTGNLYFGFFSVMKSIQGDFKWAASAIILAGVFDMLDGRVARLTGGTSEFGVQYDSLCDLLSFGMAPAFLMYKFGLNGFGRLGYLLCFLFLACGALRLARFNVQSSIGKGSGDFTGLPIPMAAAVVAAFVATVVEFQNLSASEHWVLHEIKFLFLRPDYNSLFLAVLCPVLALEMVSNFAYRSHKVLRIRSIKPFKILVFGVLLFTLAAWQPEFFGFVFCISYALSGPLEYLLGWKKAHDDDEFFRPLHEDESVMEPGEE